MEKNTIIAVVLSIVVLIGFYFVQGIFFPPQQQAPLEQPVSSAPVQPAAPGDSPAPPPLPSGTPVVGLDPVQDASVAAQQVVVETRLIRVELTNAGGDVVSFKLREHLDGEDYVDMILSTPETRAKAFSIAFGNLYAPPVDTLFFVNRISDYIVEFYQDFSFSGDNTNKFRLTKRYTFSPDEYMFELTVTLDGDYSIPPLNFSGVAYTLCFGPQIGPRFDTLDGRYDYRRYYTYANGKRKEEKIKENAQSIITSRVSWAAIAGKYFTFIAVPDATQYELAFSAKAEPGISAASRFYMTRPALAASKTTDTYRFYMGPKSQGALAAYDTGTNSFNLRDMDLAKAASTSGILSPVEAVLKWFLSLFYKIVPNYGVAIMLLTLLVKALLFPLTKKGSEATLRMQKLSPKIKEIQEKYKDKPQQMNAKMAELYKEEGYNPMSGCFPLLIQFPIFIAMYNLFNNHFDLRGAMFIPGWIPDLSVPESVFSFAPHKLPFLGWSDLRLLPFIYVGSQLLMGKVTQTPDQQGNSQMKMMLYVMPLMFFFILYNVPSGLTVYWIMTNFLSLVQQLAINKYLKKKKAAMGIETAPSQPVIVPPKARRKHK
ncbi:MAG: membrane protein insertase YidC [Treponema sp.]|jgi:YidC/Oxa1 family membrane protein insertase|nr:membrane protein insertase YidC [Treponema sp.]